jgi:hypothetical protein
MRMGGASANSGNGGSRTAAASKDQGLLLVAKLAPRQASRSPHVDTLAMPAGDMYSARSFGCDMAVRRSERRRSQQLSRGTMSRKPKLRYRRHSRHSTWGGDSASMVGITSHRPAHSAFSLQPSAAMGRRSSVVGRQVLWASAPLPEAVVQIQ